jgi:hypothetical protein
VYLDELADAQSQVAFPVHKKIDHLVAKVLESIRCQGQLSQDFLRSETVSEDLVLH